jgi:hypothetical protein
VGVEEDAELAGEVVAEDGVGDTLESIELEAAEGEASEMVIEGKLVVPGVAGVRLEANRISLSQRCEDKGRHDDKTQDEFLQGCSKEG